MKQLTDEAILALAADHKLPVRFPHEVVAFARDFMAQQVGVRDLPRYDLVEISYGSGYMTTWEKVLELDPDGEWCKYADVLAAAPAVVQAEVSAAKVSAAARVLADRSAEACNVDKDDNWKVYSEDFIEDARAALEAAEKAKP